MDDAFVGIAIHMDSERRERIEHAIDIVGVEEPADRRRARRKRGEQQCPIGDAFRAGQRDHALGASRRREVEKRDRGVSHARELASQTAPASAALLRARCGRPGENRSPFAPRQ